MRVLLLGGPFDWRTVDVADDLSVLYVPIPERESLMASVDPHEPVSADFKVARYAITGGLAHRGALVGSIFEYQETT